MYLLPQIVHNPETWAPTDRSLAIALMFFCVWATLDHEGTPQWQKCPKMTAKTKKDTRQLAQLHWEAPKDWRHSNTSQTFDDTTVHAANLCKPESLPVSKQIQNRNPMVKLVHRCCDSLKDLSLKLFGARTISKLSKNPSPRSTHKGHHLQGRNHGEALGTVTETVPDHRKKHGLHGLAYGLQHLRPHEPEIPIKKRHVWVKSNQVIKFEASSLQHQREHPNPMADCSEETIRCSLHRHNKGLPHWGGTYLRSKPPNSPGPRETCVTWMVLEWSIRLIRFFDWVRL